MKKYEKIKNFRYTPEVQKLEEKILDSSVQVLLKELLDFRQNEELIDDLQLRSKWLKVVYREIAKHSETKEWPAEFCTCVCLLGWGYLFEVVQKSSLKEPDRLPVQTNNNLH